ncbi:MAG: hypothetical protein P1V20_16745 [Verrucomicrobiales bacterium]|nr:hypothetical protein [Verrucomicrobiales bacterium]
MQILRNYIAILTVATISVLSGGCANDQPNQIKKQLESEYGINIYFDFSENSMGSNYPSMRCEEVPYGLRAVALKRLRTDLEKYNPMCIRENLNSVHIIKSIVINDLEHGGAAWDKIIIITADLLGDDGRTLIAAGFHHEYSSILLKKKFNFSSVKKTWSSFNKEGFSYASNTSSSESLKYGLNDVIGNHNTFSKGFACDYGQVSVEDDFNTIAQLFVAKPASLLLLSVRYPIIEKKNGFMIKTYLQNDVLSRKRREELLGTQQMEYWLKRSLISQ